MDSIYSAVFGDTSKDNSQNPAQQRTTDNIQNPAQQRTETNPFRGAVGNDGSPLRHAAGTTTHSGPVLGGSGTQHTAGSAGPAADHRIDLNKPIANIYESRPADSGKPFEPARADYPATHAPGLAHPSDRPTTTTSSTLEKPSVGDLNKDGFRHEASGIQRPLGAGPHSEERPTISDTTSVSEAQRSLRSNLHENDLHSTHAHPGTHEHATLDPLSGSRDRTHEHQTGFGVQPPHTGAQPPHTASTGVASAFTSTTGEHLVSGVSDSRDRSHQSGVDLEGGRDRTHDLHHKTGTVTHSHMDQSRLHDKPGASTMGEHHGLDMSSTDAHKPVGLDTHKPSTDTYKPSTDTYKPSTATYKPSTDTYKPSADTHKSVGLDTHKPSTDTHKPSGLDTHKPSTGLASTTAPNPIPGPGGVVLPVQEKSTESGTGEKYEKSTGVAAEGGDFDASRPGAGREADRLLDEHGIHHGPEKKKDVDADKEVHKKTAVGTEHKKAEEAGTEHKGLGEKIKEKLHLGHH